MSFFKKLFGSSKNEEEPAKTGKINLDPENSDGIKAIMREDYFKKRYTEIDPEKEKVVFEGPKKMLDSFIIEGLLDEPVDGDVCQPENLDFLVKGGFLEFCRKYKMEDNAAIVMLAYAFSEYMTIHHKMKLYKDNEPEFPARFLTLQLNMNGTIISLYPFEYSLRVLEGERTFVGIVNQIKEKEQNPPPSVKDLLDNMK